MNLKEALKRIEELERRVRELEARAPTETHYHHHYHQNPAWPGPWQPPYYYNPVWCGVVGVQDNQLMLGPVAG